MDPYKGGAVLGEAIFGSGSPDAYEKQIRSVAQSESAVQQARRARSLALIDAARQEARSKINADLLGRAMAGDLAAQSELGASVLGGNQTMDINHLRQFGRPHYGQNVNAAQEALTLGDIPTYNKFTAAAAGDPYQPVRQLGGAYIPDGTTLGDIEMVPTPATAASISQGQQRTNAAVAKAGRAPAGRTNKPPTTAQAEAVELANARAAVAQGADPAAVAGALRARGFPNLASKIHAAAK